ncbi:MAG: hypothetical protein F9K28_10715 [Bacteroidetes bacterium]|nr:MAG: hypothetical protein F9K28_10715 [Bacteroidota bacterium]
MELGQDSVQCTNFTYELNGNISSWAWNSRRASGASDTAMASVYHYDLLNRIRTDSTRLRGASAWSAVGSHWQSSYTYDGNGNIQTLYRANATGSQMDNLTYTYTIGTNKLINISDYQGASTGADIGDQDGNNYAYDATGNMTQDTAAGIEAGGIVWSPYNKIKSITKMGDDTTSKLVYHYDATGNRILKRYYKPYNTLKSTTWYVRDAQGNTLATYTKPSDSSTARQHEVMLYGSTRLAVAETQAPYSDSETDTLGIFDRVSSRTLGTKRYELTDHLGNVRATVTDVVNDHSGDLDAELSTRTDYYPFGMIMGGRNSSADDAHRYGFNGKENDNEVKGEGVQQDYGFRIYDARVARFLSVDPLEKEYPFVSAYANTLNSPIHFVDADGRLVTDSDGNIVVTFTGSRQQIQMTKYETRTVNGKEVYSAIMYSGRYGKALLNNGTPIDVIQADAASAYFIDKNGNRIGDVVNSDPTSNCLGWAISSGCLVIPTNGLSDGFLLAEGAKKVQPMDVVAGDIGVYFDKKGEINHVELFTSSGDVSHKPGIMPVETGEKPKANPQVDGGYGRLRLSGNKPLSSADAQGSVEGGLRVVDNDSFEALGSEAGRDEAKAKEPD